MAGDTVRMQVAAWLDRRMNGPETLCRPRAAMVFAPHPDDETLGCGGTVVKLRRAGVDVHIVFMTDGRHSHDAHTAMRAAGPAHAARYDWDAVTATLAGHYARLLDT